MAVRLGVLLVALTAGWLTYGGTPLAPAPHGSGAGWSSPAFSSG